KSGRFAVPVCSKEVGSVSRFGHCRSPSRPPGFRKSYKIKKIPLLIDQIIAKLARPVRESLLEKSGRFAVPVWRKAVGSVSRFGQNDNRGQFQSVVAQRHGSVIGNELVVIL
ncbi:hypothetical protein MLC59_19565, partial [Marinobacter bryozoorum]|uniref:hypothetical protein n=1 Tax=Marinobacter bryozoorum TaxID=256324 RepID=UPI002004C0FA